MTREPSRTPQRLLRLAFFVCGGRSPRPLQVIDDAITSVRPVKWDGRRRGRIDHPVGSGAAQVRAVDAIAHCSSCPEGAGRPSISRFRVRMTPKLPIRASVGPVALGESSIAHHDDQEVQL